MINFCVNESLFNFEKYRINSGRVNINAPIVRYEDYFLERAVY